MKQLLTFAMAAALLGGSVTLMAHCQVPCGIYHDKTETIRIYEDLGTIEKCMNEINRISAEKKAGLQSAGPLDQHQREPCGQNPESGLAVFHAPACCTRGSRQQGVPGVCQEINSPARSARRCDEMQAGNRSLRTQAYEGNAESIRKSVSARRRRQRPHTLIMAAIQKKRIRSISYRKQTSGILRFRHSILPRFRRRYSDGETPNSRRNAVEK